MKQVNWITLIIPIVFVLISAIFFAPSTFQGKVLHQGDAQKVEHMRTECEKYTAETGKTPLWTNAMFSGMPAYQIMYPNKGNLLYPIFQASYLFQGIQSPFAGVLLGMLTMFFLMLIMGIDWIGAALAGIGYGFCSYNMDLVDAGHVTKLAALGFAPLILAGAIMTTRVSQRWVGLGVFGIGLGLQLLANHVQITYYTGIIIIIFGLFNLIQSVRNQNVGNFAWSTFIMFIGLFLAVIANTEKLWPNYEYAEESKRGRSELTPIEAQGETANGLNYDYAFQWSLGLSETMTLIMPKFMGGGASHSYEGTEIYRRFHKRLVADMMSQGMSRREAIRMADGQIGSLMYDGDQPFVGVGIYFGIVLFALLIMALVASPSRWKWWLLAAMIMMLSIAWGKNFFLNKIWFDTLPFFNKFRAVTMALGLVQLTGAALAGLGLYTILDDRVDSKKRMRAIFISVIALGSLMLIFAAGASAFDFGGRINANMSPDVAKVIKQTRMNLFRSDALKGLLFVIVTGGLGYLAVKGTLKRNLAGIGIILICLIDLWIVNAEIIRPIKYDDAKVAHRDLAPSATDQQILKDPDPYYRVLDQDRGNPFQNSDPSVFHKSIGGYHAAKLLRYDQLIARKISSSQEGALPILGMLNCKYLVNQGRVMALEQACGNAWFVDKFRVVPNADAEMNLLGSFDPKNEAVINESFASLVQGKSFTKDSTDFIGLLSYHPDTLRYRYSAKSDQLAVFSEIYYPEDKGWHLYVNNQRVSFSKANFLLRYAVLPAGQNQSLAFIFEPQSVILGTQFSRIGSGLLLLVSVISFAIYWRNRQRTKPRVA